jgi:hypothetical protein
LSDIRVTRLEPGRYGVAVSEGTVTTTHKVALSGELLDDLGLFEVDPLVVVEEAFAFLLDREPASAIQGDFPVEQIAQRYPDFYDELRTRLGV